MTAVSQTASQRGQALLASNEQCLTNGKVYIVECQYLNINQSTSLAW